MDFAGCNVLTFDVGGSHISAGLCDLEKLQVIHASSAPLPAVVSFDGFVDLLYILGREAAGAERDISGASLAVPGPFDCDAGVSLMKHKLESLYGKDLRGALAARFGWEPEQLRFLNDASAFLLGEVSAGSVRGAKRAAGITLGTGIGSAFARDGHCVTDGMGVPPGGEIWNIPYGDGTVEDLISTRALKAEYAARTGKDEEVVDIAAGAKTNADARRVFESFGLHLGQVLRDVIAPFHPDMVVVGGGISRSAELFLPIAQKQIDGLGIRVVTSSLLDQAALVGAAAFWRDELGPASEPSAVALPDSFVPSSL